MNLINSNPNPNPNPMSISQIFTNRKARILNLVICFLILGCGGLETNSFQFCDNFNEPLDCTEPKTEKDVIYLDQKLFKKENPSFEDFGNFLYFTARETPGFRFVLSKPYNGLGKETFRSGYVAYLKYGNSSERMEGNLFQNNVVVSFHYLGALLKEEFRRKGIDQSPFRLEDLGSISLEYKVMVPGMEPITKQRVVELRWK